MIALGTQAIGSAVVLNLILWLALPVSIPSTGFEPLYATAAAIGAALIALFGGAVVFIRRGSTDFAGRVASWAGRIPKVEEDRVRTAMFNVAEQVNILSRDRRRLQVVLGLATANWLLDAAVSFVALSAFGHRPSIVGLLVAYGLANVMAAIPISPGGLGVVEAILIFIFIAFGTPATEAAVGVVLYRLVSFWLPIPLGALSYLLVEQATGFGRRGRGFIREMNEATTSST